MCYIDIEYILIKGHYSQNVIERWVNYDNTAAKYGLPKHRIFTNSFRRTYSTRPSDAESKCYSKNALFCIVLVGCQPGTYRTDDWHSNRNREIDNQNNFQKWTPCFGRSALSNFSLYKPSHSASRKSTGFHGSGSCCRGYKGAPENASSKQAANQSGPPFHAQQWPFEQKGCRSGYWPVTDAYNDNSSSNRSRWTSIPDRQTSRSKVGLPNHTGNKSRNFSAVRFRYHHPGKDLWRGYFGRVTGSLQHKRPGSYCTPPSFIDGIEENQKIIASTDYGIKKNIQIALQSNEAPFLAESLFATKGRPFVQQKILHRASMVSLHMQGFEDQEIAFFTRSHERTVQRWICRIEEGNPLTDLQRSGRPRSYSEAVRLATIAVYCQKSPPLPGVHRWSLRDAQHYFKEHPDILGGSASRATIKRILDEHALRPHRSRYYLQVTDPDFFTKMEHIIDLYLNPPENLYCFDECTCIQALKRLTPNIPAGKNQPVLEDFDYRRNGTTDLIAFLNPATGTVYGQCASNHDRHTLCRIFTDQVQTLPADSVIHYITDNLTTHYHEEFCQTVANLSDVEYPSLKTGVQRREWLSSENKRIVVHFVPFHASWLNMVEIWFGILKNKCLNYDHFYSVEQLRQDICTYIGTWNDCFAHPFTWSYTGEGLHVKAVRRFTSLLSIETEQMDCKFLKSQLLLMCNIAEKYKEKIPRKDWKLFVKVAVDKKRYMTDIIDNDTGPLRKKAAQKAYNMFVKTVCGN